MNYDRIFDSFLSLKERDNHTLRKLIRNRRAKKACCDDVYSQYILARESGTAVGENGDVLTFFQWLLEHADEIISLVQRIMSLFGV